MACQHNDHCLIVADGEVWKIIDIKDRILRAWRPYLGPIAIMVEIDLLRFDHEMYALVASEYIEADIRSGRWT